MNPRSVIMNWFPSGAQACAFRLALACLTLFVFSQVAFADRVHLKNGAVMEVDEVWENADGVWFRRGRVTQMIERELVSRIERGIGEKATSGATGGRTPTFVAPKDEAVTLQKTQPPVPETIWIHLVGGAKIEVDAADEKTEGVWYKRDTLSIFLEKSRVERVEHVSLAPSARPPAGVRRQYAWTTGRNELDWLIRQNGERYGVDPYLIFLVMEHESHFRTRAVSPAGARGLMQLMPGTARRFGVNNVFDPAQSVRGGTRYLKELLGMWDGRVDLALASYNAGEGAVMKYGRKVPPYRETRNYVRLIGARYGNRTAALPSVKPPQETSPENGPAQP